MTEVSIIIPTYNGAEWLADAVESALAQTTKCEIIVIDDGSTDNTQNLLKDYPVKVIHQINKGLPSARNTGIMNAAGEYILPLDADDMLNEDCVEKLLIVARATNADVISPSFKTFGKDNSLVVLLPAPQIKDFMLGNRVGYCSMIRRSVLLEVGGYSPKMVWGYEDLALWFDLLKRGKTIVTVQEPLWLYRTKDTSMMTESLKHHDELMAQIAKDNPELFHA